MGVPVTGTIQTTAPGVDIYATIDPIEGIDGWRSVADHSTRNAITTLRRREGMAVWTRNDGVLWVLNPSPWAGDDTDWTAFAQTGGTVTLSGDASGSGTTAITVTVSSYDGGTAFGTMAAQDADAVAITGGTITGLPMPTGGSDAATKAYVDAFTTGLSPRESCRVATATALTATYDNGTAGVGATLTNSDTQAAIEIDGVSLDADDRVLVKNQSSAAQNGIYKVTTVGSGSTNWVLTRAIDYDQASDSEVVTGSYTVISAGTANQATLWVETGLGPFVIGTTAISWTQLYAAGITTVLSGDVTGTGIGAITTTIANNAVTTTKIADSQVTYAKIQNTSAHVLLGNPTGSATAVSEITLGSGLSFSGTTLVATGSGGTVTSIATGTGLTGGTITDSGTISLASIASPSLLANTSGGVAAPIATTLTALIDSAISSTQGTILYRSNSAWTALAPGTNGQVLATQGASSNPHWITISTGTSSSTLTWLLAVDSMAATGTGIGLWRIAPANMTFARADVCAVIAPTGADLILDIELSSDGGATWSSLWAITPANQPTIADGANAGSTTSFDVVSITAGTLLRASISQVGSTVPGQNITLQLTG